jgi:hypothetical protein
MIILFFPVCISQIQQIVERSTIGLNNRQKQKQQQQQNSINVPKKLLDTVLQKLGLGNGRALENGGVRLRRDDDEADVVEDGDVSPTSSEARVELDSNKVLDLFMSLFGNASSVQQQGHMPGVGRKGATGGNNHNHHMPADATASQDAYFGRVYSIDTDTNSLDSSSSMNDPSSFHRHGSSGESVCSHSHSRTGVAAAAAGAPAGAAGGAGASGSAMKSAKSQASQFSGVSLPSEDGTISLHREGSNASVPSLSGAGSSSEAASPQPIPRANNHASSDPFLRRNHRERKMSLPDEMELEDRENSYDSTISIDCSELHKQQKKNGTYMGTAGAGAGVGVGVGVGAAATAAAAMGGAAQHQQGGGGGGGAGGGTINGNGNGKGSVTGITALLLENLGKDLDASGMEDSGEVPASPGSGGAAHLAEALKKLRQVLCFFVWFSSCLIYVFFFYIHFFYTLLLLCCSFIYCRWMRFWSSWAYSGPTQKWCWIC